MTELRTRPGTSSPLGASWDGEGTNFAIYSEDATGVELCLFDEAGGEERRVAVRSRTELVWHVHVEGVGPGTRYGYRIDGPWQPERGLRFNPNVLLLDPYALAVDGVEAWDRGAFAYDLDHPDRDLVRATADQRAAPLGIVIDRRFDWEGDAPPNVPLEDAVIYEAHVKGLSMRHPHVAPELRGTYGGVASEPIVNHLRGLGVTSVELLPIHHFVDDKFLLDKGLRNYWGYSSIGFFAPDPRYRAGAEPGAEVRQFKEMVKALHRAGLEVILDVVYNHTAEGNHLGPTFSLKGVDNRTYYRLVPDSPRHYFDYTGTGNSLNVRHPQTLRLIMDSLRYWVDEMHVDGFRFDLASTLARSLHEVDRLSSFFVIINQDPIIGRVKLIAEPWDVGDGGYQVGGFPVKWSEWNGRYRDAVRSFWKGAPGKVPEIGYRLTGSSDLYQDDGRRPSSSINLITAHDGFTLRDLVSYDEKHNQANGEGNADGANDNESWNCGVEGPTDDPAIEALRARQVRNLLATLVLSQGTPMLCGGDELGRTQAGNNNAYCQDSELSWHDWELDEPRRALLEFTRRLLRLRAEHATFRRARWFKGRPIRGLEIDDLIWIRHDGARMSDEDWQNSMTSSVGMFLAGTGVDEVDEQGRPRIDDDFLLLFNASDVDLPFALPGFHARGASQPWRLELDTAEDAARATREAGATTTLRARSTQVYRRPAPSRAGGHVEGAPASTYRLQLHGGFDFRAAAEVVPYLAALGCGAVYTSPYSHAEAGSTHGYNVTDHAALNPELGGEGGHAVFATALRDHAIGHLLDVVPNHVGIGAGENRWWQDVLENGPASLHAGHFDVDWTPPTPGLHGKVLLPVLGQQYGAELEDGRLSVVRDGGRFFVAYHERRWPAAPRTYRWLLAPALARLALAKDDPGRLELESVLTAVDHLPLPTETDDGRRDERAREKEIIKRRLGDLCQARPEIAAAIDEELAALNPRDGSAGDVERLDGFLREQNYRLAFWRVATEEINYRRFFDVNELAAIRMEDPAVFEATHTLILDLVGRGVVTGLRLDHTDGLYEPQAYFDTLQARAREARRAAGRAATGDLYVVAEKILEHGEALPRDWRIAGTTGYEFLAAIGGLWIDRRAEARMTELYARVTGARTDFAAMVFDAKRTILESSMSAETIMLGQALRRLAEADRRSRDFTLVSLTEALKDVIAAFPVYRTYLRPDGSRGPADDGHIAHAIELAKRKNRRLDPSVFDYVGDVISLRRRGPAEVHFAMRFQQLTGPAMAKGVEDTAVYRFNRLVALNEVGCDPARFGEPTEAFHRHNATMLGAFPLSMTATSTHDTKRSEDVRARLAVLSELPERWEAAVASWLELAAAHRREVHGVAAPSANDAYLFFQTVVGIWPFEGAADDELTERVAAYMAKAIREAKLETSWNAPDAAYEDAVAGFVRGLLGDDRFRAGVAELAAALAPAGACNSIAQLALRLASPGVPDVYQGSELWDLSLVDPDNRRPVDYARRRAALDGLRARGEPTAGLGRELIERYADGHLKLHVLRTGLALRRRAPLVFLEGGYLPIDAGEHVVGFRRSQGEVDLVCLVPRLPWTLAGPGGWPLGDAWGERRVELGRASGWREAFTGARHDGGELRLADVFRDFPVAWLWAEPGEPPLSARAG